MGRLTFVAREEADGSLDGMERRDYQVKTCVAYADVLGKRAQKQLNIRESRDERIKAFQDLPSYISGSAGSLYSACHLISQGNIASTRHH